MAFLDEFEAITLVTDRLAEARAFYLEGLGAPLVFEDDACAMVRIGPLVVNLLQREAAGALVQPGTPGRDGDPARTVFTLRVPDVDRVCADLAGRGVAILDGPADRPWGRRTATFADPSGHLWELAQVLGA